MQFTRRSFPVKLFCKSLQVDLDCIDYLQKLLKRQGVDAAVRDDRGSEPLFLCQFQDIIHVLVGYNRLGVGETDRSSF